VAEPVLVRVFVAAGAGEPARKCGRKSFEPMMPTKFLSAPVMPVFMCVLSLGTFRITSALSTVLLTG
jgi:hypothetical protein